jgi:hypothetical protein
VARVLSFLPENAGFLVARLLHDQPLHHSSLVCGSRQKSDLTCGVLQRIAQVLQRPAQRPATSCNVGRERATGIEPAFSAWEALLGRSAELAEPGNALVML